MYILEAETTHFIILSKDAMWQQRRQINWWL